MQRMQDLDPASLMLSIPSSDTKSTPSVSDKRGHFNFAERGHYGFGITLKCANLHG